MAKNIKIYHDDQLVHDCELCTNPGGQVGWYDHVDQTFHPIDISELEPYLCNAGTQYIDTGFVLAVDVVHGRWTKDLSTPWEPMTNERHVNDIHVCSNCRNMALSGDVDYFLTDYCPFCGARMEGSAPEEEEAEVCEACEITYSWERGSANVLGETNDADD